MCRGLLPLLHCQKPEAFKDFMLKEKQLLPGRCCVFCVAGAALGSEIGPLVWGFLTCSVITCCRQVVLLDAFAPWFSWHQRFTWRQAATFPGSDLNASELVVSSRGSDLNASELVVSSRVPKCLHRTGSFGPQNGGQKARRKTRPLSLASTVLTSSRAKKAML